MIYVCVPVHNEAKTVGRALEGPPGIHRLPAGVQIIACDDASTDGTADVLSAYARVLPLTVIKHRSRQGYARSLEELLKVALQRTDRPKRDCAITLHADFVHAPETMEEMVKRLESGADLVVRAIPEPRVASAFVAGALARQWARGCSASAGREGFDLRFRGAAAGRAATGDCSPGADRRS